MARVVGILEFLALRPAGESLTSISRALGAPKTSLVGLLKGLQQLEYVLRKEDRYVLGPAASAFAMSVIPGRNVVHLARPLLRQLAHETGETALFGVPSASRDLAVYVDTVESENPVRYTVPIGEPRDLYCSAVGKCLLAHFDDQSLARYLKTHRLVAHTARTITSASKLQEELKRIRGSGVAFSEDERMVGVSAVAAPVFARDSEPIAVFVVGGPTDRFRAHRQEYAEAARAVARELSRVLGLLGAERAPK
ncbi:MAG: IclR family transcriptional regulator [Betaproteobacteria bacterium]|nr:IclR family transcriptional regulator [Betaproteobacteria bacterium]